MVSQTCFSIYKYFFVAAVFIYLNVYIMSCAWGVQCALFIRKVCKCNDSQESQLYINNHLVKMEGYYYGLLCSSLERRDVENPAVRQFGYSRLIRSTASFVR